MKKLLLCSVALTGLAFAAPAFADEQSDPTMGGVSLSIGGHYKGYLAYVDQDEVAGSEARNLDWLQDTEIHFTGETTLDNGLTVGGHIEAEADNSDGFEVEESYAYFSGAWGRINAGAENGAAYLLQVAAPSADSNVDGLRQFVQPVNYSVTSYAGFANGLTAGEFIGATANTAGAVNFTGATTTLNLFGELDYDDDVSGYANKLSYMTPVFSGFQAGLSFTPELETSDASLSGVGADDVSGQYGNTYEIALRYAGEYEGFGFALGGGFTHSELEADLAAGTIYIESGATAGFQAAQDTNIGLEDRQSWNAGLDLDVGAFGLGAAYVNDDLGIDGNADRDTWVIGTDYTNGPWKLGASYYNSEQELIGSDELDTDRYTGGVVYTYGPGMTFRGSISYIDHETNTQGDVDATSVLLGTQINF